MTTMSPVLQLACLIVGAIATCMVWLRQRSRTRFPPGPPGLPVIGNIFDLGGKDWLTYENWGIKYGSDIIHLKLLNTHVVVLNSAQASRDLLEKRSNIYSDRAHTVMLHELTGWHRAVGFMPYDDTWRAHRRAIHQHFRLQGASAFHPHITWKVREMLHLIVQSPQKFLDHYRYMAGSLSLDISYGFQVTPDDPILDVAEKGVRSLFEIGNAGAYLVDSLPILKHLPQWFPGAYFKRQAEVWKAMVDGLYLMPFEKARVEWEQGRLGMSLASKLFQACDDGKLGDYTSAKELIINVAGVAYAAGIDTTVAVLQTFTLAMLLHPDVQVRAREELNRTTGSNRLPTLEDRESLPYTTAIMKEVLRWHPVVPLGIPHKSVLDDQYRGYFIPGGSIIIGNAWAILHDDKRYPSPEIFDPNRFLTDSGKINDDICDPTELFGFGRRICPGRHFAADLLWLSMSNILATFNIDKTLNEYGEVIKPQEEFTSGLVSMPVSVEAAFKVCSSLLQKG